MNSGNNKNNKKVERKVIEKNRRNQMKHLCLKLVSLIPPHHFHPPKEYLSLQDQIDQAAGYIGKLSGRVENLKRRKAKVMLKRGNSVSGSGRSDSLLPILKVRELADSVLEVVVITGLTATDFAMHRVVRLLGEEGADVVALTISNTGHKIFHSLLAQAKVPRVGVDISRICGRLEELTMF